MLKIVFAIILFSVPVYAEDLPPIEPLPVDAGVLSTVGSLSVGYDTIDVYGQINLNVSTGLNTLRGIRFPDGTLQTTANLVGPQGPQGIPGPPGVSGGTYGFSQLETFYIDPNNEWQTSDTWQPLTGLIYVIPRNSYSYVKFDANINIGVYSNNWCSIGLFIDGSTQPYCVNSWSGVGYDTTFNNQTFSCVHANLSAGTHTVQLKHRSQYCHYFNAHDPSVSSSNSYLLIQEIIR